MQPNETHVTPQDAAPELRYVRGQMVPDHGSLNDSLRSLILEMAGHPPDRVSNMPSGESYFRNKWLSKNDLHLRPEGCVQKIVAHSLRMAGGFDWPGVARGHAFRVASMWTIVSQRGMEGSPHSHNGVVSGAYYVDAADCNEEASGAFVIYGAGGRVVRAVRPESGLLLLFPSGLLHGVKRYESDRSRIVISLNLV